MADGFEAAFSVLQRAGLRDEYVYRTAVTRKAFMGRHSLNTACMLTEFRTGTCKADLVILNNTATVYEIKSDRDSLARMKNQISNYRNVFASVNVITGRCHIDAVLAAVPEDVGVLCLSERFRIQTVRKALAQPERIRPLDVFESLPSNEVKMVLRQLGEPVPEVPNTRLRTELRPLFSNQEPAAVHAAAVATLRRTRSQAWLGGLINELPPSLHAAALYTKPGISMHDRLLSAVSTPLAEAMAWK